MCCNCFCFCCNAKHSDISRGSSHVCCHLCLIEEINLFCFDNFRKRPLHSSNLSIWQGPSLSLNFLRPPFSSMLIYVIFQKISVAPKGFIIANFKVGQYNKAIGQNQNHPFSFMPSSVVFSPNCWMKTFLISSWDMFVNNFLTLDWRIIRYWSTLVLSGNHSFEAIDSKYFVVV